MVLHDSEEKSVVTLGLKQYLDQIDTKFYELIKNVPVNAFRAKALVKVLEQITYQCSYAIGSYHSDNDMFIAKGYNIKISDVMEKCPNEIKYIIIFALNNLIIDTDIDKTGGQVQLALIAPKWYVIGKRTINLSGAKGISHTAERARNATDCFSAGDDGNPGYPGGPAGHIMAIGTEFINSHNLEVFLNGGEGGDGQHGGYGLSSFLIFTGR